MLAKFASSLVVPEILKLSHALNALNCVPSSVRTVTASDGSNLVGFVAFNKINELFRDLSNYYVKVSLFMNITFSRSCKIFVTSEETKKVIPSRYHFKTEKLLAIGFDETSKPNSKSRNNAGSFNICCAGNLLYLKGLTISLKTFLK